MLAVMANVVSLINDMLGASKTLEGVPAWQIVGSRGEHRMLLPLAIDGKACGAHVELNAYPNIEELRFRIMLFAQKCVWRVDYVNDEIHVNPIGQASDIPKGPFAEPHYHAWRDNHWFSTQNNLPDRLPIAKLLPPIRQFDATFRWFCGETNIVQPPSGLIELPPRSALF